MNINLCCNEISHLFVFGKTFLCRAHPDLLYVRPVGDYCLVTTTLDCQILILSAAASSTTDKFLSHDFATFQFALHLTLLPFQWVSMQIIHFLLVRCASISCIHVGSQ